MPTGSFARATRRDTICSLTTRDPVEKTQVQFIRKMSWTLFSGVIIGMIINMVVLPMWLEKDINGYPILMVSLSINKGVEKALEKTLQTGELARDALATSAGRVLELVFKSDTCQSL